jgi:hypothetical protein
VIAKLNAETSLPHEKHLVLAVMVMPDKFPLELNELYFLAVKLSRCLWAPVFAEERKLVIEIDRNA